MQGKITVENTVDGIVDSSLVYKGMGFMKLLGQHPCYRIFFLLTSVEMALSVNVVCLPL